MIVLNTQNVKILIIHEIKRVFREVKEELRLKLRENDLPILLIRKLPKLLRQWL